MDKQTVRKMADRFCPDCAGLNVCFCKNLPRWFPLAVLIGMLVVPGCRSDRQTDHADLKAAPKQAEPTDVTLRSLSAADSATYTIVYTLSKPLRTSVNNGPDTAKISFRRDSTLGVPRVVFSSRNRYAQKDSGQWVIPKVIGKLAKYTACAWVQKNTAGPNKCQSFTTNIPVPVDTTSPPVVDSIRIDSSLTQVSLILVPPVANLAQDWRAPYSAANPYLTGAKRQMCVFHVALDGKARMPRSQQALDYCRQAYDRLPINQRLPGYPVAYQKAG